MRKIVLLCAAGMSTSMLVKKMQESAATDNYECEIAAYSITESVERVKDAAVVLLGPQVRFQLKKIQEVATCPVEAIDMTAYGMMDGKKVMAQVKKMLGE